MTQMNNSKFDTSKTQMMSENNDTSHAITPPTQFSFISQNTLRKECVDVIDI